MFFLLGWSLTFVLQTWNWSSLVFQRGLLPDSAALSFSFTLMWNSPLLPSNSQVLSSLSLLGDTCAQRGQQKPCFCCDSSLQLNSVFPQAALLSHLSDNLSAYLQTCSDFKHFSGAVWSQESIGDQNHIFFFGIVKCLETLIGIWDYYQCWQLTGRVQCPACQMPNASCPFPVVVR